MENENNESPRSTFLKLTEKAILTKPFARRFRIGDRIEENALFECSLCGDTLAVMNGERLPPCEFCYPKNQINAWIKRPEKVTFAAKNPNVIFERRSSIVGKASDLITDFSGTMFFVFIHVIWFVIWMAINLNLTPIKPFDPFPFGLLTMVVSLEAIFLSTFVLITQNRITERSEIRSELDYRVNVNSEKLITEALGSLRDIREIVEKMEKTPLVVCDKNRRNKK